MFRSLLLLATVALPLQGQGPLDSTRFHGLHWRMIGPWRGGRVTAVAGHADQPLTYYMGATGGGVWRTTDAGITWQPMTDSTRMSGSIGAIAVAPSDPNVVYVGTGEATVRGNVAPGNGLYRSTDGGRSWQARGLADAGQITEIVIHPRDENLVYAAVLGHIFGPNPMRGVYRSRDGGGTWERVLFRSDSAGAIHLEMDPTNPRVLYAALWQARRYPWTFVSGGPGSGLFKSTDGGDSWTEITRNPGLPAGVIGKIGVAVSPANPQRVWAIVEAEEGGVFRSEDGGGTWRRVNEERRLRQRAWYYTYIHEDPRDPNTVYVLNTGFYRSVDAGATYEAIRVPHGDNHDLWIAPNDPARMINSNDGGANVSFNGGASWTPQDNQPTAQMYHAFATAEGPFYRVCGGQQDNSTICVPSRTTGGSIGTSDYDVGVGGCESGHVAVRPDNPDVSFAGCYGGQLDRYDRATGQERAINVWPVNPMGWGADSLRERFQWTYPIVLSPHDPDLLYVTSQHVWRSRNEGQSWERMSGDLTRNDKAKQGPSGGSITRDDTSVEYYGTVFSFAPSPRDSQVLWAGSDDGLIHVTRDGGRTWTNVTPRDLPEWTMISTIEASSHDPGTAYVAATRYKLDDFTPYLYRTSDYGRTWRRITAGIPATHYTRVIRADPVRPGLLYAGGEFGVYVSFDEGARWQSLQLDLPITPVHDLVVHEGDLVAATHGRSFWILDDLGPLRQAADVAGTPVAHLYRPRSALRIRGGGGFGGGGGPGASSNPPNGVVVDFVVRRPEGDSTPVTLEFLEADGTRIARYASNARERSERLEVANGHNRFAWNLRYPEAARFDGLIMWAGSTAGPQAVPGQYQVKLTVGGWEATVPVTVVLDPRLRVSQADLQAQFDFLIEIRDAVSAANNGVTQIRNVRSAVEGAVGRIPQGQGDSVRALARSITADLGAIERELYQTQNRSNQDPLNFPIRLNNKIAALNGLVSSAEARPTDQARETFVVLKAELDGLLARMNVIIGTRVPAFNEAVAGLNLPAVSVDRM